MIQIFGPELRVHPLSVERRFALEFRLVALIVAVVASAHHKKTTAITAHAIGRIDRQLPLAALTTPVCCHEFLAEANTLTNPILVCSLIHIAEDRRAVGDTLLCLPRLEVVTERMHVTVRANAGIAK